MSARLERLIIVATKMRDTGYRLQVFTLAAGILAVLAPEGMLAATWVALACFLGGTLLLMTRKASRDPALTWVVGGSFVLRCIVALALFVVSSQDLPILRPLHDKYGLWVFGADGVFVHETALQILEVWRWGIDLSPAVPKDAPLSIPAAFLYSLVGVSPLHVMAVNAWLGAVSGLLAYLLAIRLGDRRGALVAATLVAFWPSSIVWSTQLLKDPLVCALILSALLCVTVLWQRTLAGAARDSRVFVTLALWGGLAAAAFGVAFVRTLLGAVLLVSVSVILLPAVRRAWLGRWRQAVTAVGIVGVMATATIGGMYLDVAPWVSSSTPEVGHVRRGDSLRNAGEMQQAAAAYRRAIELNPSHAPAQRGLGDVLASLDAAAAAKPSPPITVTDVNADAPVRDVNAGAPVADVTASAPDVKPIVPAQVVSLRTRIAENLRWLRLDTWLSMRRAAVLAAGGTLVDAETFNGLSGLLFYLPRALLLAFLAPFPWDLISTSGSSGVFRSVGAVESVLIMLLVPVMLLGCWQQVRRSRPEVWVILVFIVCVAIGTVLMRPNGGSLFRYRIQFLFPALIVSSVAWPAVTAYLFRRTSRSGRSPIDLPPAEAVH